MKEKDEDFAFQIPVIPEDLVEEDGIMIFPYDDDDGDGELKELNFDR